MEVLEILRQLTDLLERQGQHDREGALPVRTLCTAPLAPPIARSWGSNTWPPSTAVAGLAPPSCSSPASWSRPLGWMPPPPRTLPRSSTSRGSPARHAWLRGPILSPWSGRRMPAGRLLRAWPYSRWGPSPATGWWHPPPVPGGLSRPPRSGSSVALLLGADHRLASGPSPRRQGSLRQHRCLPPSAQLRSCGSTGGCSSPGRSTSFWGCRRGPCEWWSRGSAWGPWRRPQRTGRLRPPAGRSSRRHRWAQREPPALEVVWKARAGRRAWSSGLGAADSPWSCMRTLTRSSGWGEQPATIEAMPPSTKPLTPIFLRPTVSDLAENGCVKPRDSLASKRPLEGVAPSFRRGTRETREIWGIDSPTGTPVGAGVHLAGYDRGDGNGDRMPWMKSEARWVSETFDGDGWRIDRVKLSALCCFCSFEFNMTKEEVEFICKVRQNNETRWKKKQNKSRKGSCILGQGGPLGLSSPSPQIPTSTQMSPWYRKRKTARQTVCPMSKRSWLLKI